MYRWMPLVIAVISSGFLTGPVSARDYCAGYEATRAFAFKEVCVSSALASHQGNVYDVTSLIDASDATAWCEDVNGDGIGQTITFTMSNAAPVRGLRIRNGYAKSGDIYAKNSRVQFLLMTLTAGAVKQTERQWLIELEDRPGEQVIALPWEVNDPVKLTLAVQAVYPGNKYEDTCMNAVSLDFGG